MMADPEKGKSMTTRNGLTPEQLKRTTNGLWVGQRVVDFRGVMHGVVVATETDRGPGRSDKVTVEVDGVNHTNYCNVWKDEAKVERAAARERAVEDHAKFLASALTTEALAWRLDRLAENVRWSTKHEREAYLREAAARLRESIPERERGN